MKLRLLACVGLLAALVPGPALADASYLAVDDEGPGVTAVNLACANPKVTTPQKHYVHVTGPATPPLGTGSLRLDPSPEERAGFQFEGGSRFLSDLAAPGAFAVSAYSPDGSGVVAAYLRTSVAGVLWFGVATLPALPAGTWTSLDLSNATYHWVDTDNANAVDLKPIDFALTKGNNLFRAGVLVNGCGGGSAVYVDKLVGHLVNGAAQTIDFESIYPTTLTASGGGLIVAGETATLTGALKTPGQLQRSNLILTLQADPWPLDGAYFNVASPATDDNGQSAANHRPMETTAYRWTYPGAPFYGPSVSDAVLVEVSPLVTMKMKDTTLKVRDKVVVKGTTTPVKAGVRVMLMRRVKGGEAVLLSTRTTRANGTYEFAKRLKTRGTWRIYVVVAASTGNVQGKSFRTKVRVS